MSYKKQKLIKVYEDTYKYCKKNKKKFDKCVTTIYKGIIKEYKIPRPFNTTNAPILIIEEDTLSAALKLSEEKLNPLVLNMASEYVPGGGVRKGSTAQEESLFRRTNYCLHLNKEVVEYPLQFDQVVYCSRIAVIKDEQYRDIPYNEYFSFLACPGLRNPKLTSDGKLNSKQRNLLKQKIRIIFQTAAFHGHDSLVLGALGTGAFNNPKEDVAKIFKSVIEEYQPGVFKKIVFAILGTHTCNVFRNILLS